jgi:hypothetical protein
LKSGIVLHGAEFRGVLLFVFSFQERSGREIPVRAEIPSDWMGGQSGPTMDSGDFIDESDYAPSPQPVTSSKTIQVFRRL